MVNNTQVLENYSAVPKGLLMGRNQQKVSLPDKMMGSTSS